MWNSIWVWIHLFYLQFSHFFLLLFIYIYVWLWCIYCYVCDGYYEETWIKCVMKCIWPKCLHMFTAHIRIFFLFKFFFFISFHFHHLESVLLNNMLKLVLNTHFNYASFCCIFSATEFIEIQEFFFISFSFNTALFSRI